MNINLNNYHYSYANAIGTTLNQPLFKLISNVAIAAGSAQPWEIPAWRITKIAFHCLIAATFIIPAGILWLAGKAIIHISQTQINDKALHLAPPQIPIPQENDSIDIQQISDKFNQLNTTRSNQECLLRLCEWVKNENTNLYSNDSSKRELFCKQVSLLLKGIITKLESGKISKDTEKQILMELAEASTRCYPTWLEVASKLYAEVNEQAETAELKLLRLVQEYKESLILEFSQQEVNAHWNALNYIRNILGKELGLNIQLNHFDPYAQGVDKTFGKNLSKWLFLQRYHNANRLISSIETSINLQDYNPVYHDFLLKIVKEKRINNPEGYVAEHFYTEDYKLNSVAVNLMLKKIGILK